MPPWPQVKMASNISDARFRAFLLITQARIMVKTISNKAGNERTRNQGNKNANYSTCQPCDRSSGIRDRPSLPRSSFPWSLIPCYRCLLMLNLLSTDESRRLRAYFEESGYAEPTLKKHLGAAELPS